MEDCLTISDYLRGMTAYEIPDNAIRAILYRRGLTPTASTDSLDERMLDLCTADLYMWCATTPSTKNKTEESDGQWKSVNGGWSTSAYDKRQLRAAAEVLYAKWEETVATTSKVKIYNL